MTTSPKFQMSRKCPESNCKTKKHLPTKPNSCGWSTITMNVCKTTISDDSEKKARLSESDEPFNLLTQKSLDMCTEVLGSESGRCCSDLFDLFPVTSTEDSVETKMKNNKKTSTERSLRSSKLTNVPPPFPVLKSMAGGNSVRIRRCRENGKSVLKATMEPSSCFLLVTERSVGSDGEGPKLCIRYFDRYQTALNSGCFSTRLVTRYHPVIRSLQEVSEEDEVEEVAGSVHMGVEYKRGRYECKKEELSAEVAVPNGQNRRYTSDFSTIRCY